MNKNDITIEVTAVEYNLLFNVFSCGCYELRKNGAQKKECPDHGAGIVGVMKVTRRQRMSIEVNSLFSGCLSLAEMVADLPDELDQESLARKAKEEFSEQWNEDHDKAVERFLLPRVDQLRASSTDVSSGAPGAA